MDFEGVVVAVEPEAEAGEGLEVVGVEEEEVEAAHLLAEMQEVVLEQEVDTTENLTASV